MAAIKNIIFDLGGVLINIDYNKTAHAFNSLGINDFTSMYAQFTADALFEGLETGQTSENVFYDFMTKKGSSPLQIPEIQLAWNAMILDIREESFVFLKTIDKKYNLYLLSNTNAIHKAAFEKIFTDQTSWPSIDSFFKKAYYSHLVGLRKPNENIYQFVLNDARIVAEETLFIDDSINNIEGAARVGIKTHLLKPDEKIEDLQYGLI